MSEMCEASASPSVCCAPLDAPREWFPCHRVFESLAKVAPPWRSAPAVIAMDADPDYLALATDTGQLYWYNRNEDYLQKLKFEGSRSPVCFIKIVSTVDYMVACGNKIGQVTIYQIPKPHPDTVPDYIKPKTNSQIERYCVYDLHKAQITSLEWSKNGTKLFSGDINGVVIQTEIDFYMHISKSFEIINESYEIVQLSYYHDHLLISSIARSILCYRDNSKWNVNQVGKKDRRGLSRFGGVFHYNYDKPNDIHIYTVRPGLRIWNSDFQGNVNETLLFKDAVLNPLSYVILLNPATKKVNLTHKDLNFGPLHVFNEKYIVSHSENILYILDPSNLTAIATVDEFRRIISVSVNKHEIFVLEGEHSIVRLSYVPDVIVQKTDERMTKSLMNPIQLAINTIKDIANSETKLYFSDKDSQNDHRIHDSSIPTYTDTTSVIKAEECFELPPVKDLTDELDNEIVEQLIFSMNLSENSENGAKCDTKNGCSMLNSNNAHSSTDKKYIFEEQVENISHITKKVKRVTPTIVPIHESFEASIIVLESSDSKLTKPNEMISQLNLNLLPENKSPESLEKDIQDKEEMLAKMLNLEPITISSIVPPTLKSESKETKPNVSYAKDEDDSNVKITKTHAKYETSKKKILPDLTPKCVSIPNKWNLQEIKIDSNSRPKIEKKLEINTAGVEDTDWELI